MDIPRPESSQLILDDCRRLTGPSLVWDKPGAILDVLIEDMDMDAVLECWYRHARALLAKIGCEQRELTHRRFENGFNLLIEAPIDQLYAAVQTLETAWYFCSCELLKVEIQQPEALLDAIREAMREELNPALIELQQAALERGVDFLVDDEYVCVGQGCGSISWPFDQLPTPQQVDWGRVHDVPLALVTGTNGKSTSVRLLDSIARAAKQVSGLTSTDFVRVGDDVLDRGDYSGPGGARLLLRDKRLQVAFLEVARGGILRRGLPLQRARTALVTNIARDHLGQYGINNLQALTQTKLVVRKALGEDGVLVLNADDENLVDAMQDNNTGNICWFSLDSDNAQVHRQIAGNGRCCYAEAGEIFYCEDGVAQALCRIEDIPMTLDGAALHNVQNVLGVVGVARAMDYSSEQICRGLQSFYSDRRDNPGRMNLFALENGARAIVDYAHNAHGINALVATLSRMKSNRLWVLSSAAGDRSNESIGNIVEGLASLKPDRVVIVELEHYLRGRQPGEISQVLKQAYLDRGFKPKQLGFAASPLAGVEQILEQLQAGDLALLLVLDQREEVFQLLEEHAG